MKTNLLIAGLIVATLVGGAVFADPTELDRKTVTSKAYVDTELLTKQPNITAQQDGDDYALTYPATTGGQPRSRKIETSLGDDDHLVTRGAINTALNDKQPVISGGTPANVTTYNSTGSVGGSGGATGRAVYSSTGSYTGHTDDLAEVQHVNAAVQNGFNAHLTCNGWEGNFNATTDPNNDHCLTYMVNDLTGGTYVPQTTSNP